MEWKAPRTSFSDVPLLPEANRRIVFNLLSDWIFRERFVNGKQPSTLHVNHTFWYILLPSSAELRCEIPNVVLKQVETDEEVFFSIVSNLIVVPNNSFPGKFASVLTSFASWNNH